MWCNRMRPGAANGRAARGHGLAFRLPCGMCGRRGSMRRVRMRVAI
ncbi:hypothetical protein BN940_17171 [Castellaniella defragrans 65Phen]|uniref:Uncharacterized protein n=1 Tax=Castellaniella defragrans (strain DSM 12143 / CCUG 39792 / 65Phen) TaxID=1437824 RepID=W8X5R9_CASD6|nr:hypothetical protein BN940_17171 [Castellaniella defragrans 65Phen]